MNDRQWPRIAAGASVVVLAIGIIALQALDIGIGSALVYQLPGLSMVAAAYVVDAKFELRGTARFLLLSAAAWIASNAAFQYGHPLPRDIAVIFLTLPLVTLLHALLALPSGHLRRRADRVIVIANYVMALVVAPVLTLLSPPQVRCDQCLPPVLKVGDGIPDVFVGLGVLGGLLLSVASAAVLVRRWRRETGAARKLLGPVLLVGAYAAIANVLQNAAGDNTGRVATFQFAAGHRVSDAVSLNFLIAFSLVALAVPFGVWRATRSAGAFGRLAPRLTGEPTADELRVLLTDALGDPSVTLDLNPPPVAEPAPKGRAHSDVTFAGSLVARLDHDEVLLSQRDALDTVVSTLGLLLGRRRMERDVDVHESHLQVALDAARTDTDLVGSLRQLRAAFDAYVDRGVASRVLDAKDGAIGSESVDVTVLFLDVRDFTSYSQHTSPAEVVALLNGFWGLVVPIVQAHGGHANKFIGDGLLAIFGAPTRLADHPDHAVAAAVDIARAVADRYTGEVAIGIGLNSGEVVAGSVGGGGRLEFTVIGDVVNTAARVESTTRTTGDTILMTEATRARLRSSPTVEPRPGQRLKGRRGTEDLFAVAF